jgi:hypothetical protein
MYILNNSEATKQITFIAGTGGVTKGDLVNLTTGTVLPAVTADATILGVATETAIADAEVSVEILENFTVEADYTGTFAATDIGTGFDLSDSQTVNQAAVLNGDLILVGYNSTVNKGQFIVLAANRVL